MITERDIKAAIDECHAVDNPTADTCRKLASYYIIQDHLTGSDGMYSYAPPPDAIQAGHTIMIDSGTEFARAVDGKEIDDVLPVMDELMTVLQAVHPRLYAGVMRKLQ